MTGQLWRIDLPELWKPITLNQRHHHMVKARRTRAFRNATCLLARQLRIPKLDRIRIELHYAPRHNRRRDPLN